MTLNRRYLAMVGAVITLPILGFTAGSYVWANEPSANGTESETQLTLPSDTPALATSDFPTNAKGLTYGSVADATNAADMPDLIGVMSDTGVLGFVKKADHLESEPNFSSPQEALAWQEEVVARGGITVPVYNLDVTEQVGTFTFDVGTVSMEPPAELGD